MSEPPFEDSTLNRLLLFRQERFSLGENGTLIALLAFGNLSAFQELFWQNPQNFLLIPLLFSFFFRLRIFDDVKDFETDKTDNPDRALARGSVGVKELLSTACFLLLLELTCVFLFLREGFVAYLLVSLYTIVMFKEFFIGPLLRKSLTLYAVTHTFCIALLVSSLYYCIGASLERGELVIIGIANWALFNFYEFARKTFAADEEREGVDSYSLDFGRAGAVVLSLSQLLICWYLLWPASAPGLSILLAALATFLLLAVFYLLKNQKQSGALYRNGSLVVLGLYYLGLGFEGMYS